MKVLFYKPRQKGVFISDVVHMTKMNFKAYYSVKSQLMQIIYIGGD